MGPKCFSTCVEVQVLPFIDFIKRDHKRLRSAFSKALLIFRGAIDARGLTSLEVLVYNLTKIWAKRY